MGSYSYQAENITYDQIQPETQVITKKGQAPIRSTQASNLSVSSQLQSTNTSIKTKNSKNWKLFMQAAIVSTWASNLFIQVPMDVI